MSKVQRSIFLMVVAAAFLIAGLIVVLFAEDFVFRIVGVIVFAAAVPLGIAGGRGLRGPR